MNVSIGGTNNNTYGSVVYAGGLVGSNGSGAITKSYATGAVTVSSPNTSANTYLDVYAGGLVGLDDLSSTGGPISNSYATGAVNVTLAAKNTSNTSFLYVDAGGLIGNNGLGLVANSYATGAVNVSVPGNANTFTIVSAGDSSGKTAITPVLPAAR